VIEAELSAGARVPAWLRAMRGFCRYVAPALIAGILVHNL
jgi:NSS family neurotransmitter:Na+ symporter